MREDARRRTETAAYRRMRDLRNVHLVGKSGGNWESISTGWFIWSCIELELTLIWMFPAYWPAAQPFPILPNSR